MTLAGRGSGSSCRNALLDLYQCYGSQECLDVVLLLESGQPPLACSAYEPALVACQ